MATCNPCVSLPCANQGDLQVYSLQSGIQFNSPTISIIVNCPAGSTCVGFPKTVTYPPGTFTYNLPDPNPPEGTILRMNGCLGAVTRTVPANATAAEIAALVQEIIQEVAEQQAYCDTIESNPPPSTPVLNDAVSQVIDCDEGKNVVFTGSLPSYITLDSDTDTFTLKAGIFAGSSKSEANSNAAAFLAAWISEHEAEIECVGCEIIVVAIGPPTEGEPYSQVIAQTGFTTPFWSISAGALPSGLTINSSTGEIAGTPTECGGPFAFTVRAAFEEGSDVFCEHEFTFSVDCLFEDMTWIVQTDTTIGSASGNHSEGGNSYSMEGFGPEFTSSRRTINLKGTMNHAGTGSIIPSKLTININRISGVSGYFPSGSNFARVEIDAAIEAFQSGLSTTGEVVLTFDLPAANSLVEVTVGLDVAIGLVNTPDAHLTHSGVLGYDPP